MPIMYIFCRSAYCQKCAHAERPQKGNLFLIIGAKKKKWEMKRAISDNVIGFTPHIYLSQVPFHLNDKGRAVMWKVCTINTCRITWRMPAEYDPRYNIKEYYTDAEIEAIAKQLLEAARSTTLDVKDAKALTELWHGWTGYTLL